MSESVIKNKEMLGPLSVDSTQQQSFSDACSLTVKPQDDPDAPPLLELQSEQFQLVIEFESEDKIVGRNFYQDQISPTELKRSRTRSQDNQYTILGFLQKKTKIRNMSEEFNQKVKIFDQKQ